MLIRITTKAGQLLEEIIMSENTNDDKQTNNSKDLVETTISENNKPGNLAAESERLETQFLSEHVCKHQTDDTKNKEQTKTNNVIPVQDYLELRWMLKNVLSLDGYTHIDETEIVEAVIRGAKTYRGTCKEIMHQLYDDYTDKVIAWQECMEYQVIENEAYKEIMTWLRNTGYVYDVSCDTVDLGEEVIDGKIAEIAETFYTIKIKDKPGHTYRSNSWQDILEKMRRDFPTSAAISWHKDFHNIEEPSNGQPEDPRKLMKELAEME
jgi:hypothetical protein